MHWTLTGEAAGAALVLSAASLGWQVVTWRGTGPKIKVQIDKLTDDDVRRGDSGLIRVIIRNGGRSGTGVWPVRLVLVGRDRLGRRRREIGEAIFPVPTFKGEIANFIDAHSAAAFPFGVSEVMLAVHGGQSRYVRVRADLGSGVRRWSRPIEVLDRTGNPSSDFRGVTGGVTE